VKGYAIRAENIIVLTLINPTENHEPKTA
jgi:hypothetical protein